MIRRFVRVLLGAPGFVWHAVSAVFGTVPRHHALLKAALWLFLAPLLVVNARLLWLNREQLRRVAALLAKRLRKLELARRLARWASRARGAPLSGRRPWSVSLVDLAETLGEAAVDAVLRVSAKAQAQKPSLVGGGPPANARGGAAAWVGGAPVWASAPPEDVKGGGLRAADDAYPARVIAEVDGIYG
jgi:hypothetical protein